MKKFWSLLFCLTICLALSACKSQGVSDSASVAAAASFTFSQEEVQQAVSCVKEEFTQFSGCELTNLWYDEEDVSFYRDRYVADKEIDPENVLILLSDFKVLKDSGDGVFTAGTVYRDWQWILTRENEKEPWQVSDWGY